MTDPTQPPILLADIAAAGAALANLDDRARRIYATLRWSGVVAVTEMTDGFDAAMRVVNDGPQVYYPDDADWGMEKISASGVIAINYIEGNQNP